MLLTSSCFLLKKHHHFVCVKCYKTSRVMTAALWERSICRLWREAGYIPFWNIACLRHNYRWFLTKSGEFSGWLRLCKTDFMVASHSKEFLEHKPTWVLGGGRGWVGREDGRDFWEGFSSLQLFPRHGKIKFTVFVFLVLMCFYKTWIFKKETTQRNCSGCIWHLV